MKKTNLTPAVMLKKSAALLKVPVSLLAALTIGSTLALTGVPAAGNSPAYAMPAAHTAATRTAASAHESAAAAPSASNDYIFPRSSYEYLGKSDLEGLSKEELRLGRNEIYARHGRRFNDKTLQWYFDAKPWYQGTIAPGDFKESVLNPWEKENIRRITQAESGNLTDFGGTESPAARDASSADGHTQTPAAGTPAQALTADELRNMERLLIPKYAGFFTCTYAAPLDIIWGSVFYSGFDGRELDNFEAVRNEYEAMTGEEVFTDITAFRRSEVEAIVRETTGTEYSQARHPLDGDWVWLPKLRAYGYEHGDTNLVGIHFTEGQVSGDEMRLYYPVPDSYYYNSGVAENVVTLRKNGHGGWWFWSNQGR